MARVPSTLNWDDGDTSDTLRKSGGEIRRPNMGVLTQEGALSIRLLEHEFALY